MKNDLTGGSIGTIIESWKKLALVVKDSFALVILLIGKSIVQKNVSLNLNHGDVQKVLNIKFLRKIQHGLKKVRDYHQKRNLKRDILLLIQFLKVSIEEKKQNLRKIGKVGIKEFPTLQFITKNILTSYQESQVT